MSKMCSRRKQLTYWWTGSWERTQKGQDTRQPFKGNPSDLLTPLRLLMVNPARHSSIDHSTDEVSNFRIQLHLNRTMSWESSISVSWGGHYFVLTSNNSQHCYNQVCRWGHQNISILNPHRPFCCFRHCIINCSMQVCWASFRDNWVVSGSGPHSCFLPWDVSLTLYGDAQHLLEAYISHNLEGGQQIMLSRVIWDPLCRFPLRSDSLLPGVMASSLVYLCVAPLLSPFHFSSHTLIPEEFFPNEWPVHSLHSSDCTSREPRPNSWEIIY